IRTGCFCGASVLAPKVEFPREGGSYGCGIRFERLVDGFLLGNALVDGRGPEANGRKLISSCNAQLCLCFHDSRRRHANVIVLFQSGANQLLELWILKDFPPLLISEGLFGRRRGLSLQIAYGLRSSGISVLSLRL